MTEAAAPYGTPTIKNGWVWVFNEECLEQALTHYVTSMPDGDEVSQAIRQFLMSDAAISAGLVRQALPER